ncbi:hypothetical protein BVRB_7g162410 [Beta vulgaris subsp. vulgaris]|nr:hypothetical protein BVRB_7g162410 [Beta vulgaris subsp. vulgaris]
MTVFFPQSPSTLKLLVLRVHSLASHLSSVLYLVS